MKVWTDYPFRENDTPGEMAPVRKVSLVSYDGNKEATIRYRGKLYEFKAGYLYSRPRRSDDGNYRQRRRQAMAMRKVLVARLGPPFWKRMEEGA